MGSVHLSSKRHKILDILNPRTKNKTMIKTDEKSNAQSWELEIICKNKKYFDEVIAALLKHGMMSFEVEVGDVITTGPKWNSRYIVLIWCSWFNNLANLANDLQEIEERLERI